jgi:pre-mRNA 3'-end-processing factor FIP1
VLEDNTSLFDVDIDSLETKPWRAAGAHLADYFNYGMDESAWKVYVARQKAIRDEREASKEKPFRVFADLPVQEAWQTLPPELKGMLMNTIMSSMPGGMNPMAMMMGGMMPGMMPPGMGPPGMPPGMPAGMPPMMMNQPPRVADNGSGPQDNGWGERHAPKRPKIEDGSQAPEDEYDESNQDGNGWGDAGRGRGAANRGGRGGGKGGNPFGVIPPSVLARAAQVGRAEPAAAPPAGPRHQSPLPANIPTGPRRGPPGPLPTGPRGERSKSYKDKDAEGGARSSVALDYHDSSRDRGRSSRSRRRDNSDYSDEDDHGRSSRYRKRSRSRSYDSRD